MLFEQCREIAVWEPWMIQGPEANDFLVRIQPAMTLSATTRGGIKALY